MSAQFLSQQHFKISPDQALLQAIRDNNAPLVEQALLRGADLNYEASKPIRFSTVLGLEFILKLLLTRGALIEGLDQQSLLDAALSNHYSTLFFLFTRYTLADPVIIKKNAWSQLLCSLASNNSANNTLILDFLLKQGVSIAESSSNNALLLAVRHANFLVLKFLLAQHIPEIEESKQQAFLLALDQRLNPALKLIEIFKNSGFDPRLNNFEALKKILKLSQIDLRVKLSLLTWIRELNSDLSEQLRQIAESSSEPEARAQLSLCLTLSKIPRALAIQFAPPEAAITPQLSLADCHILTSCRSLAFGTQKDSSPPLPVLPHEIWQHIFSFNLPYIYSEPSLTTACTAKPKQKTLAPSLPKIHPFFSRTINQDFLEKKEASLLCCDFLPEPLIELLKLKQNLSLLKDLPAPYLAILQTLQNAVSCLFHCHAFKIRTQKIIAALQEWSHSHPSPETFATSPKLPSLLLKQFKALEKYCAYSPDEIVFHFSP